MEVAWERVEFIMPKREVFSGMGEIGAGTETLVNEGHTASELAGWGRT